MYRDLKNLISEIKACTLCAEEMKRPPNPVLQVSSVARILIAGQAPGNLAEQTGIPFNDPSGNRLRASLGVDADTFYDTARFNIVPMGFCFPGYDEHGADIPPMKKCAEV